MGLNAVIQILVIGPFQGTNMILYYAFKFPGNIHKSALDFHVEHPYFWIFPKLWKGGKPSSHPFPRSVTSLPRSNQKTWPAYNPPSPKAGSAPESHGSKWKSIYDFLNEVSISAHRHTHCKNYRYV